MKIHFDSMMKPVRRDGVEGGVLAARLEVAGGRGSWSQRSSGGTPPQRAYPPPVYRREEDLYVIGEHVGMGRGRRG